MKKSDALRCFIENSDNGFNDYYEMQLAWSFFTDGLARDNLITSKQRENWDNPCKVDTFTRWHKKNFGTEHR